MFTLGLFQIVDLLNATVIRRASDATCCVGVAIQAEKVHDDNLFIAVDASKYSAGDGSLGFSGNEDSVFGLGGFLNGHGQIALAVGKGAACVIVDETGSLTDVCSAGPVCLLRVPDSLEAIVSLANNWQRLVQSRTIAVTGSTGKTTTTSAIAALIGAYEPILNPRKTRTTRLGLAMDILQNVSPRRRTIVVEYQMDGVGQIASLCGVAQPDIAVITSINNSHLQRFGSSAVILEEKLTVYKALRRNRGLVVNGDDPVLRAWLRREQPHAVLTYGVGLDNDIRAEVMATPDRGFRQTVRFEVNGERQIGTIEGLGSQLVYSGMAGVAVLISLGYSLRQAVEQLHLIRGVAGRLQVFRGRDNCLVIDDSYNANLLSMSNAIQALCDLRVGRRVAFIGSMLELGPDSEADHRELGRRLIGRVDVLITVGEAAEYTAFEVLSSGFNPKALYVCHSAEEAIALIDGLQLDEETGVLVKGSGAMRMERVSLNLVGHLAS